MDLTELVNLWPIGVVLTAGGGVGLALARCAVADVVVRISAWMYAADAQQRREKREAWLRDVEDMSPAERPAHAGSLLWMGLRALPGRLHSAWLLRRAGTIEVAQAFVPPGRAAIEARGPRSGDGVMWLRIWWWCWRLVVSPARERNLARLVNSLPERRRSGLIVLEDSDRLVLVSYIDRRTLLRIELVQRREGTRAG